MITTVSMKKTRHFRAHCICINVDSAAHPFSRLVQFPKAICVALPRGVPAIAQPAVGECSDSEKVAYSGSKGSVKWTCKLAHSSATDLIYRDVKGTDVKHSEDFSWDPLST